jgi:hypothetical protein
MCLHHLQAHAAAKASANAAETALRNELERRLGPFKTDLRIGPETMRRQPDQQALLRRPQGQELRPFQTEVKTLSGQGRQSAQ